MEFEYGFSTDVLGAVIEQVSEQRLGDCLTRSLGSPSQCKMPLSICRNGNASVSRVHFRRTP
nr:hypothetical protein [Bradyrhizobium sp. CCBAU 11357]